MNVLTSLLAAAATGVGLAASTEPLAPSVPALPAGCPIAERVTRLGQWFDPAQTLSAAHPILNRPAPTAQGFLPVGMRLLLRMQNVGDRRWRLVVRDPQQRTLLVLTAEDFPTVSGGGPPERWTGILPWPSVVLDLENPSSAVSIALAAGIALPRASGENVFSLKREGYPDWQDLYGPAIDDLSMRRAGEAVGMIQSAEIVGGVKQSWSCSGVMAGPDLLLTNWHCGGTSAVLDGDYWTDACRNAVIDLGWDGGKVRRQLGCAAVVAKDKDLDFALLRVRPVLGGGAALRVAPARISLAPVTALQPVYLIHHAAGDVKLVSSNCHIEETARPAWTSAADSGPGPDLTHTCDSERGSSGGGLFDVSGELVALHHAGFSRDAQCRFIGNRAVRIGAIVAKLPSDVRAELDIQ